MVVCIFVCIFIVQLFDILKKMGINENIHKIQKFKHVESVHSEDAVDEYKTLVVTIDKQLKEKHAIDKLIDDIKNTFEIGSNCERIYSIAHDQISLNINYTNEEPKKNNNVYFITMSLLVVFFLVLYIYMDIK